MSRGREQDAVDAAERWFVQHGLPYFVDSERESARAGMQPKRLLTVLAVAGVLGLAAAAVVVWLGDDSFSVGTFMVTAGAVVGVYAATTLRMTAMARSNHSNAWRGLSRPR